MVIPKTPHKYLPKKSHKSQKIVAAWCVPVPAGQCRCWYHKNFAPAARRVFKPKHLFLEIISTTKDKGGENQRNRRPGGHARSDFRKTRRRSSSKSGNWTKTGDGQDTSQPDPIQPPPGIARPLAHAPISATAPRVPASGAKHALLKQQGEPAASGVPRRPISNFNPKKRRTTTC
jgi:hypothetical protein